MDGRIRLLRILAVVAFLIVGGRAIALASTASSLERLAAGQQRAAVVLPAHRGTIVDSDGKELAVGEPRMTVYATPYLLDHPRAAAADLCRALKIRARRDRVRLADELGDGQSGFVYVARQADPDLARRALALDLPGVGAYDEEARSYPMSGVAAQLLGFVGTDHEGLAGLEKHFDAELRGRDGSEMVVRDPAGRTLKTLRVQEPVSGEGMRLTIDADIQYEAERTLERTVRTFSAKAGMAVVLDPATGEVLAMANVPRLGGNAFGRTPEFERNRPVTDAYEPGSIFKAVTIAGALSDGLVKPSTRFTLPPSIHVADREIHEAHPRGTVSWDVREIITQSSNVGAVVIGQKMGQKRLLKWLDRFGFGEATGIEFPGEAAGIVPREWSGSTIGNLPMGQGVATTPLQMACAFATLANDGVRVQPHVVAQVGAQVRPPAERRRVVSARVARQMVDMLTDVVERGTGTAAQIPGYAVAGKTGTAQKPLPDGSGYSKYGYMASFVGIVPAGDPRLVVLVTVDEPHPIWGGVVAAPAVRDIATFSLQHLEIAP